MTQTNEHNSNRYAGDAEPPIVIATIQSGLLTMPDGRTFDLLKIQAALNFAFQETGEHELMEACDLMAKITGLEQNPDGSFAAPTAEASIDPANLVVDGLDEAANFAGDGKRAPFVVFDVDRQENIAGPFLTRDLAEQHRLEILAGNPPRLDSPALARVLTDMDEGRPRLDRGARWPAIFGDDMVCKNQAELDDYLGRSDGLLQSEPPMIPALGTEPVEHGSELDTQLCFAVGELERDQLEDAAADANVEFDKWTSNDDLRTRLLDSLRMAGLAIKVAESLLPKKIART